MPASTSAVPTVSYETLRQREEQLRHLIDGSADIIYEADAHGYFTFVNRAVERILGHTSDSVLGRHYTELIRDDWKSAAVDHYRHQSRQAIETTAFEFPALTADGKTRWLSQNVQSVTEDGTVVGFRAIARDVTQRRLDEERFHAFMDNSPTIACGSTQQRTRDSGLPHQPRCGMRGPAAGDRRLRVTSALCTFSTNGRVEGQSCSSHFLSEQ